MVSQEYFLVYTFKSTWIKGSLNWVTNTSTVNEQLLKSMTRKLFSDLLRVKSLKIRSIYLFIYWLDWKQIQIFSGILFPKFHLDFFFFILFICLIKFYFNSYCNSENNSNNAIYFFLFYTHFVITYQDN